MSWLSTAVQKGSDFFNGRPSESERMNMAAAKEQIDFYHQQKDELHKQNDALSKQKHIEQQKINEKQIRAMRRNYRTPGFMDSASSAPGAIKDQLG